MVDPRDNPIPNARKGVDPIVLQRVGLPSPPPTAALSDLSCHHSSLNTSVRLPSSEIVGIVVSCPDDEWSNILGHANFTIYPKPYILDNCNFEAYQQFCIDWDQAWCNYIRHLVRTGRHYGTTSKTYRLTEEKWALEDEMWRRILQSYRQEPL